VTHFGCAIAEAERLADVHVFLNGYVEKRSVDVKLAELKVAGGCDGQEETQAGHADDMGERLCVVQSSALAAPFGDEQRFEAGDVTGGARLDFAYPHDVNDHATRGKVNEFPCADVDEGRILPKAARYDFGSTHSRADMRATAVGDVPASACGGPVIMSGT
jgi:hypothetical protein